MAVTAAVSPRQRTPVLDWTVRREDGAGPLIAAHDDLEQVLGGVRRELAHTEIVDDEQGHRGELVHVLLASLVEDGVHELFDEDVRLPIEHAVALPDRREPEALHEMALAGAGGPQQQDVLALADEARRGECEDQRAWDLGVEAKVEAVEGAVRISEASGLDASREEPILASDELSPTRADTVSIGAWRSLCGSRSLVSSVSAMPDRRNLRRAWSSSVTFMRDLLPRGDR